MAESCGGDFEKKKEAKTKKQSDLMVTGRDTEKDFFAFQQQYDPKITFCKGATLWGYPEGKYKDVCGCNVAKMGESSMTKYQQPFQESSRRQ